MSFSPNAAAFPQSNGFPVAAPAFHADFSSNQESLWKKTAPASGGPFQPPLSNAPPMDLWSSTIASLDTLGSPAYPPSKNQGPALNSLAAAGTSPFPSNTPASFSFSSTTNSFHSPSAHGNMNSFAPSASNVGLGTSNEFGAFATTAPVLQSRNSMANTQTQFSSNIESGNSLL